METPPDGWLTAAAAAAICGVDERTMRDWCAAGGVSARQVHGTWWIDPASRPALRIAAGALSTPVPAGGDLAGSTIAQRRRAIGRMEAVLSWQAALSERPALDKRARPVCQGPANHTVRRFLHGWLAAWNALHPARRVTASSLYRWLAARRTGGIAGLIDRRGGGRTPAAFSPAAQEFLLGLYLSDHRPSLRYVYVVAAGRAAAEGWDLPAYGTVRAWLRRRDHKLIAAGRDAKKFRDRMLPHVRRDWSQVAAMECWIADDRLADLFVPLREWDSSRRQEVLRWRRPWFTVFMDARTWLPVGWRIELEAPDADRVMAAFAAGVLAYGTPEHLILDNGKDFRAGRFAGGRGAGNRLLDEARFRPLLKTLGVTAHWAIPFNARAKTVEPWFRIMANAFDRQWPTYCGPRTDLKPESVNRLRRMALGDIDFAAWGLEAVRAAFARWVRDDYALAPSPAAACRGLSPARAIVELLRPGFVPARPAAETLALLMAPSARAAVRANGVYVAPFGRHYWAQGDAEFERRRAASGRDEARLVVYRYFPDDPSRVFIFDWRSDRFLFVATPYAGEAMHPLATAGAEQERLGAAMATHNRLGRDTRAEARRLRRNAAEVLLTAHRAGMKALGQLDDPATLPAAPPAVIRPLGQADVAAAGGIIQQEDERARASRRGPGTASLPETLAPTGTDPGDPGAGPTAEDALSALARLGGLPHGGPGPDEPGIGRIRTPR